MRSLMLQFQPASAICAGAGMGLADMLSVLRALGLQGPVVSSPCHPPAMTHKPSLFSKWHSVPSSARAASSSCLPTALHMVPIPSPTVTRPYLNTNKTPP